MALSKAILGIGSKLQMGDGGSPEDFDDIVEIKSISFDGFQVEEVDTTHMESPDRYREFKPTLKNSQFVTMESHFLPDEQTQQDLKDNMEDLAIVNWKVVLPDTTVLAFSGFVSGFTPGPIVVDNVIALTLSIRINGAVEITPPAP